MIYEADLALGSTNFKKLHTWCFDVAPLLMIILSFVNEMVNAFGKVKEILVSDVKDGFLSVMESGRRLKMGGRVHGLWSTDDGKK